MRGATHVIPVGGLVPITQKALCMRFSLSCSLIFEEIRL